MFTAVRGRKWHFLGTEILPNSPPRALTRDPRQLDWSLCNRWLALSLATRCNQKICRRARYTHSKYFIFNCSKRQSWEMCRWACRGLHWRRSGNSWRWRWSKRCGAWIWRQCGRTGEGGLEVSGHTPRRWSRCGDGETHTTSHNSQGTLFSSIGDIVSASLVCH